jgi:hypothetical protein
MYVYRNIEPHSFDHCCSGKAENITYSENVFVALGTPQAMRIGPVAICDLSDSTILFHIIS